MSPTGTRPRRNGANATGRNSSNNAAAAALQDVADATGIAAAANCEDPNILKAVLKAAATTEVPPRHLQTAGSLRQPESPTGLPTRRTATPDSEGEAQSPASESES